MFLTEDEILIE